VWGGVDGLVGGRPEQVAIQALGVAAAAVYSALASFVLLKLVGLVLPLAADGRQQSVGLDVIEHGEEAYGSGEGAVLLRPRPSEPRTVLAPGRAVPAGDAS
jgi:Amt family ammonium transporter